MNRRSIKSSILSLGALQAFNFLLSLSVIPYLAHLFGASGWGKIVFVQTIINYLIWITNWGFYWGGTKEIAKYREQTIEKQKLFSLIWSAQWFLTFGVLILLCVAVIVLPFGYENRGSYLVGAGLIIGSTLTPIWYLNGLEKIREGAFLQVATKLLALPGIFLLIHKESDIELYFVINACSSLLVGVGAIYWLVLKNEISWIAPTKLGIKTILISEFGWFKSSMIANLNSSLAPTLLGIIAGPTALGLYNLADRLRLAVITAINPISQALFPRMSFLFTHNQSEAIYLLKKMGVLIFLLTICFCFPLLIFSEAILSLLGGDEFKSAESVLLWLSMTPLFSVIVSFALYQIMIPSNQSSGYSRAMLITLTLTCILVYPLELFWGANGAAVLIFLSELFTAIYLVIYIYKNKLIVDLGS